MSNSWSYFEEKARKAIEEELKMELPGGKVSINGKYKNFDLVKKIFKIIFLLVALIYIVKLLMGFV